MENQYENKIRHTKHAIYEALIELSQEKDLQKITILELCSLAGINRSTFYKYYGSQYDVLTEMGNEFLKDISRQFSDTESGDRQIVEQRVTECFRMVKEHQQLVLLLLQNPDGREFEERLFAVPQIDKLLSDALSDCHDEEEKQATISFAIHGACYLMTEWIQDGCRTAPEKEAQQILRLARRVCNREKPAFHQKFA